MIRRSQLVVIRRSLSRRVVAGLGLALAFVACDDTSTVVPNTLNLVRPVDIAFACYGGLRVTNGTTDTTAPLSATPTAQPTTSCDIRSAERYLATTDDAGILGSEPRPPGQQDIGTTSVVGTATWFGFVLQSASGTVALTNFSSKPSSTFVGGNADVIVRDADPLTPGKNAISVGEDPVGLETDKSGCFEVVANAGSCDVATLDINSVLGNLDGTSASAPIIKRIPIVAGGQTIYAKPAAIVGEEADDVIGQSCPANPTGLAYVAFPGCHMVAALDMSDGLSAKITAAIQFDAAGVATQVTDLATLSCPVECTGAGIAPTVPTAGVRPDALAYRFDPNAKNLTTGALDPRRRLAIGASNSPVITIVDLVDAYPAVVDPANPYVAQPKPLPTTIAQVTLENDTPGKTLGVSQLALSAQLAMGGVHGTAIPDGGTGAAGGVGQYVYAVATDHTVRVADVLGFNQPVTECDTQADTRFLQPGLMDIGTKAVVLQCMPVASKPIRRATARSPGIQLPDEGTPNAVAFVHPTRAITAADGTVETQDVAPGTLVGTFAIISSTAGPAYVVNVDDNNKDAATGEVFSTTMPLATQPTLLMAHQLRHNIVHPGEGAVQVNTDSTSGLETSTTPSCLELGIANRGAPRTTAAPTQTATAATAATGSTAATKVSELPTLRQERCIAALDAANGVAVSEMELAAPEATRRLVYPDLGGMFGEQTWTMVWEGQLALDTGKAINGPTVRVGEWITNSTESASLNDHTQPFCGLGVEVGDVVQMHGCDPTLNNLDCPQDYECYVHAQTQVTLAGAVRGSCLKSGDIDQLAPACRDYLVSQRKFTVRYSSAGQLELTPRLHELRTTPLDGCTDDAQCKSLADYSLQNSLDVFDATTTVDPHAWACVDDSTRKPFLNGSTKRCVQTCKYNPDAKDTDCDIGSICVGATMTTPGVCKEGVIPPQACVTAPQQLSVRAGEAFTLVSDTSGYLNPIIENAADPHGQCIVDPKYGKNDGTSKVPMFQVGRLPLDAPACDVPGMPGSADPVSGMRPDGTFEPNPCSTVTDSWSNEVSYANGVCSSTTTTLTQRTMVPAIKLRTPTMTLTMIDPYYQGDAVCAADRGGASQIKTGDRIPLVFPSYQLGFHISSGLTPVQLQSYASVFNPVLPTRVVEGPTGSIWVLDDGDFLSGTLGLASTEGSVFRVEGRSLGIVNQVQ